MTEFRQTALNDLVENEPLLIQLASDIWEHPELGLQETYAVEKVCHILEQQGFTVQRGVGSADTACVGTWGQGGPVIGVLGEYDALPGLSQRVSAEKDPIVPGGAGHGCGHNLFAGGSLGAALAIKAAMQAHHVPGTIRFYGCPAEETLAGKVIMAQAGVFDDLDAAITWHPGGVNIPDGMSSSLAMNSFKINFYGVSTHAAAQPHLGRSALKGVQLMDIGVNYLREHLEPEVRVHCVITRGGEAPNVVPAYAQVWYYIRAPHRHQVEAIYARVLDIAKGAALMSATNFDVEFVSGCYEVLPNMTLSGALEAEMRAIGAPCFDAADHAFAKALDATVSDEARADAFDYYLGVDPSITREMIGEVLCENVLPPRMTYYPSPGSTDVGDVSQIAPTGSFNTCCAPVSLPGHSWQLVAASNSGIGYKGMMYAAKTLALTGLNLLTQPELLAAAKAEFDKASGGRKYKSPLDGQSLA